MTGDKKELEIELSDQVKKAMAKDPKLAEYMRNFIATLHQARHGVDTGQYDSMDDAMEALTGSRPEKIDINDIPEE